MAGLKSLLWFAACASGGALVYAACVAPELGTGEPTFDVGATTGQGAGPATVSSTVQTGAGAMGGGGSGMGGMGGKGGMGGMGGMPGPIVSYSVKAQAGDGTVKPALPGWLKITCPTDKRTAQTNASTIKLGLQHDMARAQSRDGNNWGLMVENARTNTAANGINSFDKWTTDGCMLTVSPVVTGTDGAANSAAAIDWTSCVVNKDGPFRSNPDQTPNSNTWTTSYWLKWPAGMGDVRATNATTSIVFPIFPLTANWALFSWTETLNNTVESAWLQKTMGSQNVVDIYSVQIEQGQYPTSLVPNSGTSPVSRAADVLALTDPKMVMPGGFFDVTIVYAPAYAHDQTDTVHHLLYLDGNNNLAYDGTNTNFVLTIAGNPLSVPAPAFNRWDVLTVRARHAPSGLLLTVKAVTLVQTAAADPYPGVTLPGKAYLLGTDKGAEEAADLFSVEFDEPK